MDFLGLTELRHKPPIKPNNIGLMLEERGLIPEGLSHGLGGPWDFLPGNGVQNRGGCQTFAVPWPTPWPFPQPFATFIKDLCGLL